MQAEELEMCLRLVGAHWPSPEMGDDEIKVWTRALVPREFDVSVKVIDGLSEQMDRRWRPSDGEFIAAYRQRGNRPPRVVAELDAPGTNAEQYELERKERGHELIAECRRVLAEAKEKPMLGKSSGKREFA